MKHYFQSKAYIAEGYIINKQQQKFDLRNLPPILRVLLSTDGTVTKTLEAYFWEAIQVLNVKQELIQLDHARDFLPSQAGEWLLQRSVELLGLMYDYLKNIIEKLIHAQKVNVDLSGPVGIVVMTNQMKEMGLPYFLQFAAIISINLAFMNFLPFPALDGGRILFLILEKIKGKPVSPKIEGTIHAIGLYILLLLMVLITFKDFSRFHDKFAMVWERIFK